MGPIPSDANEATRFGQLLQDAQDQSQYMEDLLSNLPEYTRSGRQPPNPVNSRAIARVPIPETTTVPNLPETYGYGDVPVHELVRQQVARNTEIPILRAAQALNAPVAPPAPPTPPAVPSTPGTPRTPAGMKAVNPVLMFLQLLMQHTDLNQGEGVELARRRNDPKGDPRAAANLAPDTRNGISILP